MAGAWALFGVSVETTALAMAVLQGVIAISIYATARRLRVDTWLSASAALLHLSLAWPAWPMASGHWFGELFLMLVLYVLARSTSDRPRSLSNLAMAGACAGMYIAVQYQKGIPVAVGLLALTVIERWLPSIPGRPRLPLPWALGIIAASSTAVSFVLVAPHLARAGLDQLIDQFVGTVSGYGEINQIGWGGVPQGVKILAESTVAGAFAYMPVLVVLGVVRAVSAHRRGDLSELRKLALLCVYSSFAALATGYRADFIHLAFISAPFFVFAAETAQWLWRLARRPQMERIVTIVLFVAVLVGSIDHLARVADRRQERFAYSTMTPFGRVSFWSRREVALIRRTLAAMDELSTRELFCYPACASIYLLADAENPTPYDLVFYPSVHSREHVDDILQTLDRREIDYVMVQGIPAKRDPVIRYIEQHYARVRTKDGRTVPLYRRKSQRTGKATGLENGHGKRSGAP
ncbi:MAG: hypothetical protein HRU01_27850 [Myxococcales bacterium]|nr:hypothetical protein [Myxococcales bacterium]